MNSLENQQNIGKIVLVLSDVLNQLKIYHWQTKSYSRHKASCQLIEQLTNITDKIIETIQGARNLKFIMPENYNTIKLNNQTDSTIEELLIYFKNWLLEKFPKYLSQKDKDIFNLRDELLGNVNQTLYLFTFK
jgi:hypothetical protein